MNILLSDAEHVVITQGIRLSKFHLLHMHMYAQILKRKIMRLLRVLKWATTYKLKYFVSVWSKRFSP